MKPKTKKNNYIIVFKSLKYVTEQLISGGSIFFGCISFLFSLILMEMAFPNAIEILFALARYFGAWLGICFLMCVITITFRIILSMKRK